MLVSDGIIDSGIHINASILAVMPVSVSIYTISAPISNIRSNRNQFIGIDGADSSIHTGIDINISVPTQVSLNRLW